jgi:tetratricopeptide (TPR) repeat protein
MSGDEDIEQRPSFLDQVRRWLGAEERLAEQLADLDEAVERFPQAASNYVFRGELFLRAGIHDAAVADLERALELAEQHLKNDDWGVIAQALSDRAQRSLKIARRRAGRN